jgi:hypothetical protein
LIRDHQPDVMHFPFEGRGYHHEATEVMNCLRAGRLESKIMPLNETLSNLKTMDQIRSQWSLRYPMEISVS